MEYLNEILWWALATGFIKFGSGGNKSPKPPKPNLKQSQKLTKADYKLKEKFTPRLTAAAGKADRREYDRNLDFALQRLGDQRIIGRVNRAMPEVRAQRTALNRRLQSAGRSSAEYRRAQTAMQRGLQAQQATTAQGRAAGMGDVANVQAGQVGQGAIGQALMNQALERANSTGQLSAEASRDATQAARSGMAARGMATGSAGLAAEMLNRDRFARQRQAEDLNFAQVVQSQDLLRQFNNVGNNMQAALANQQTQFGRQQIISGNQQQANMANMAALNQGSQFNAAQRDAVNRYNMGLLGTASQMSDFERSRQLGLGQDAYNFALSSNPNMVAMGLGSGYSNMTQPAMSLMGGQNMQMMYSGGKFSGQGGGFNMAGAGMGALSGAASGAMIGSVVPGIGTAVGAIGGGLLGGFGGGFSG